MVLAKEWWRILWEHDGVGVLDGAGYVTSKYSWW